MVFTVQSDNLNRTNRSISSALFTLLIHNYSSSQVGFGDCALTSAWSRLFAGFYALFSVGVVSACFAGLSGAKVLVH